MSPHLPRIDFYSARDGRRLAVRVWNAVEPPRARVVLLHGITSHGGWYHRSCRHLSESGCEVHFLDRRGAGLNAEARGDVDQYPTWLDDVTVYLERLPHDRPLILGGISWGGKLAAAVARREPGSIQGLMLVTPGIYSQFKPGALARWALRIPVRERMQRRRLEIPLQPASLFTESRLWREFVDHDPLSLRDVSYRFAQADNRLTQYAKEAAPYIYTPTLMMLSGRDRIVTNSRCRTFFGRIAANHKTLIEYPGAVHTLEFESDPSRYFADLADWIAGQGR